MVGVIGSEALADQLERDVDVLRSDAGDMPPRQRSLRAAFESSWRLLDDGQRRVLAGLSVFQAPFSPSAAEAVVGASLPTLAGLAARSLIHRVDGHYGVHELVRRYAAEALESSGAAPAIRDRHARTFNERVAARVPRLRIHESPAARRELDPELPVIRAAAAWAIAHWASDEVEPLLQGLTYMWATQVEPPGPPTFRELARLDAEERDPAADTPGTVPMHRKLASYVALSLASADDNTASDAVVDEHLPALRESGDRWDLAVCLLARGMNADNRDENAAAVAPLDEQPEEVIRGASDAVRQGRP